MCSCSHLLNCCCIKSRSVCVRSFHLWVSFQVKKEFMWWSQCMHGLCRCLSGLERWHRAVRRVSSWTGSCESVSPAAWSVTTLWFPHAALNTAVSYTAVCSWRESRAGSDDRLWCCVAVAWSCKAVSGQFYDTLLKKCLQCSELCGSHPEACADACRSESESPTESH